jgi:hypothetical protein
MICISLIAPCCIDIRFQGQIPRTQSVRILHMLRAMTAHGAARCH